MHLRRIILAVAAVFAAAAAQAEEPLFPFVVSYDSPENVTNVSDWLDAPAGKHGFVRADGARFVTDAGPIRFWATNLCFDACFPTHEESERLAERLARLGINCVRLHHMDSRSIWGKSENKLTIDPERLERLDYLIAQLKKRGVYVNINLHVSRWLDEAEGFPNREGRPNYDKGLDNFEPRMIEAQKKYARDLLTHVNPYTGTAYVNEPAVAMVEINNENALFSSWAGRDLDDLPEPYATTYRKTWNAWLRTKYATTDALRKAWNVGETPLGAEMLQGGDFGPGFERVWSLERDAQTQVEWKTQPGGPGGKTFVQMKVGKLGEVAWHPQFTQSKLRLRKGTPYTLTFSVRADQKRTLSVNAMMAHDPWERLGFDARVEAGPEWSEKSFTFVASESDENARIGFSSFQPGTYELTAVSLRPGGVVGLRKDQRLEDDSVPVVRRGQMNLTEQARFDWVDFLWDTENAYWYGMYRFLKDELAVRPMVSGTQLGWSPPHVQARLDYLDGHSYWNHPVFPNRPWDGNDWYVRNRALVNSPGGTLTGLACRRVAGQPFTVSEYNHPAPIQYEAEGFPMIAAYGAFQGWSGIFFFAYSHNSTFEPRKVDSYFDTKSSATKLVHMPACAALFLRGDVRAADRIGRIPVSLEAERQNLREMGGAWNVTADHFGIDQRHALLHAVGLDLTAQQNGLRKPLPLDPTKVFESDTGEIRWDVSEEGAGTFTVSAPRSKLFTGFVRGRTIPLGDVTLAVGPTRLDWATVSLLARDGDDFASPGRILIAATGLSENTGAKLESLGDDRITLRRNWGSEPILCEGVPAEVTLPVAADRVTFYPLDEAGNRRQAVPVDQRDGKALLRLGPQYKTLWYEAEIR